MKNKTFSPFRFAGFFLAGFFLMLSASCSKEDNLIPRNPDAMDITDYLRSLNYDPADLLNVQPVQSGNTQRTIKDSDSATDVSQGWIYSCAREDYQLDKNFDECTILRPTNGIVWPGALVYGNGEMLDGLPTPITLQRSPMILRLDLPGMGAQGTIEVDEPNNSNVQTNLDDALEWWNQNAYQDGYVNPSLSYFTASESYSSTQVGMEVDMNLNWATGSVASQLDYNSSTEKRVAVMVFKQVFYAVVMETPDEPSAVFGPNVSLSDVQGRIDNANPAAYVKSVSYGRILMFRLETTDTETDVDLSSVLTYAGGVDGSVTVNTNYEKVLKNSTITVITLGGNAEVASEAINWQGEGRGILSDIITGPNAVYSRDNPGIPIGYTIHYLKDNTLAKMGYSTDYSVNECTSRLYQHAQIKIENHHKTKNVRVKLSYKPQSGPVGETGWVTIKDETFEGKYLDPIPDGAYDVEMTVEHYKLFDGWTLLTKKNLYHVSSGQGEDCWIFKDDESFGKCN